MALFSSTEDASRAVPPEPAPMSNQATHAKDARSAAPAILFKFPPIRLGSLIGRPLLLTTLWSVVAVAVIGFLISNIYRKSAERNFEDLLRAELYHVIDSVMIGDQGALLGNPQLADLRFVQPKTGWYWMVEPLGSYRAKPLVSLSLGASNLPVVSELEVPFDKNYERHYNVPDAFGNSVQVAETEVVLDTVGRSARFRVAGNNDVVEDDVRDFSYSLYLALGGFGVGSLIVCALVRQSRPEAPH